VRTVVLPGRSGVGGGHVRVLVVAAPLVGHLLPLLPLAWALRATGHEVLLAGGGATVDTGGLPLRGVAHRVNMAGCSLRATLAVPHLVRGEYRGAADIGFAGELFGQVNARMIPEVVTVARVWEPHVVVHEPLAASGAVAAVASGAPAVLAENSLWDAPPLVVATARSPVFARAALAAGVTRLPPPALVLRTAPESLVGHRPGPLMRPEPVVSGEAPAWLRRPARRPRIVVSHTTVLGAAPGDPMPAVVAAASGVDAEIVLVRPGRRLARRAAVRGIRTVGWVPMPEVLRHADAFVHHGGAGSVLAGLAAGVPQLVTPGPGDRRHNAELVAARGAGLCVAAGEMTAAHLTALITRGDLRAAAREVAAEIAAMPAPAERVADLEALVGG
jgi:UDP-glucoronosyl and UDP-glucosyl transferase